MSVAVFMLAVLAIYVPNQGNLPTTFGVMGLNMFNILFVIALGALMLTLIGARREPQTPTPPMRGTLIAYYIVLAIALVTAFLRSTPTLLQDVVVYKEMVSYSLLYFLAYYGVRNLFQFRFLLVVILLVFVGASFEAIRQGVEYGLQDYSDLQRASGPFGEDAGFSNFAGIFYAIFATFSLTIALLGKRLKLRYRALAMACYMIGCIAILATFSRQAFLAIGITTLLLALKRNPMVAVAAVAVMLAYPLWAPQGVVERIDMTQQQTTTGEEVLEASAASRYELWRGAVLIIKGNPFGVGLNQFKREVDPYLPPWVIARDAQNMYLRFAAEAGIQGLIMFLMILWSFFHLGLRVARIHGPPEARPLGLAFSMSVIAVCLGNIFSSTFAFGEMMANYWILAGMMARYPFLLPETGRELVRHSEGAKLEELRSVYARWQGRAQEVE